MKGINHMTTSNGANQEDNVYFVDHESAAEMARLLTQDRMLTKGLEDFFPVGFDPDTAHDVLDLGCGPGGWVQEVAFAYPHLQVTGMDISQTMIAYATAQARVQKLANARFQVGDLLQPLAFSDASFDLVNARLIAFLPKEAWPKLMQECRRILRPGGMICLTEMEWITNSPACEKQYTMFTRSLKAADQSFSPDGRLIGITPMLSSFLKDAGFQGVHLAAHVLDYSFGTDAYQSIYENWRSFYKNLQPFFLSMGVATQEEADQAYEQMFVEMQRETFHGLIFMVSAIGQQP
jgi:ubiquinone/menaquinone biosynthesis C-methylase UbiE